MSKELLVNQTLSECQVALIDNGRIVDFLIDRKIGRRVVRPSVGDIYLGKVVKVLPGMQSAFVDIGHAKAAFLYVSDAYIPPRSEQRKLVEEGGREIGYDTGQIGDTIPDEMSTFSEQVSMQFSPSIPIESILSEGDEVVVQVAKEPISTKGCRVTRHVALPGRYVVFMPFIEHIGVSRRIEDDKERERLKGVLTKLRLGGQGIIARTMAEGRNYKTLRQDYLMLGKIWKDIEKSPRRQSLSSRRLYKDLNFIQRVLRDITDEGVDKIWVDSKKVLREIEKFVGKYLPDIKGKTELYDDDIPIFEKYGIDLEIERGLSNKVYLRSGGSLNIDQTEALVSIDVNTGKYVGRKSLEETVVKTNLEAVKEIAYQLRLRNCGGIIIIDFIDMEEQEHRKQVYTALLDALKEDRAKTSTLPISGFGLVEMTRKRTRDTLSRVMCSPCPYCEGTGRVKSAVTVCYEVIRELIKVIKKTSADKIDIYAHPEVTAELCSDGTSLMDALEESYGRSFFVRSENSYHIEQYEIFAHGH